MNGNWSRTGDQIKWLLLLLVPVVWLASLRVGSCVREPSYATVDEVLQTLSASSEAKISLASEDRFQMEDEGEEHEILGQVRRVGSVETVFGQVAKTVVYGGASLARLNNRLLCNFLTHETEQNNTEQPELYVFSQANDPELAFKIYAHDDVTPQLAHEARLDPNQLTYIFVHGWMGGLHKELWLSSAKDAVLKSQQQQQQTSDNNNSTFKPQILLVEWSELAKGTLYEATANSKRVASRLGRLLKQLHQSIGLQPELMHCIGHSIGAHICGRAAREAFPPGAHNLETPGSVHRLGRITAVDPGGFCYELGIRNESTFEGMRPSDALLVDAYYSNRSPFGNKFQVAQFNVRLNNGFFQRSCSVFKDPQRGAQYFRAAIRFLLGRRASMDQELLTCDHYYATQFAQQQQLPRYCSYLAYACPNYSRFLRGQCGLCSSPANCYPMDFEYQLAEPSRDHYLSHLDNHTSYLRDYQDQSNLLQGQGVPYTLRRPYYLRTSQREPLCSLTYRVQVHLSADVRHFRNEWLNLQLIGNQEEVMRVWLSASGRAGDTLRLYGPWELDDADNLYGLDNRTLTALFELLPDAQLHLAPDGSLVRPPISDLVLFYDNVEATRRSESHQSSAKPVDWVQVDYLSSKDPQIRQRLSLRRQQDQLRFVYKRLDN